ncbi:MAG: GCN5-related N-acetyltransferase [Proteobacteria bacterium]|nr:GCN5-related N-acetyltransferase [Pseudomonadota bacterium]
MLSDYEPLASGKREIDLFRGSIKVPAMADNRSLKIRLATTTDNFRISELLCSLTARYIACEFPVEAASQLLRSMDAAAIEDYLTSGYRYHVAEKNGELAGVVAILGNSHLYHLFVSERFQGQGLARVLWEAARAACLDAGTPGLFTVNASRYAVGMYEKFGFARQGEAIDRDGVICIPMKLDLG